VNAPRSVRLARWLWTAAALVSAVHLVFVLGDRQGLRDEVRQADPSLGMRQTDAAVNGEIMLGLLMIALWVGLCVLMSNRLAGGRGWARVVITLFCVGTLLLGGLGLVGATEVAFSVVGLLLDAVVLVAMYLPASNDYFRAAARATVRA
jgi:hypothetical protein